MTARRSLLATLPAAAVMAAAAVPASANAQLQALMVGGYWSGWMNQGHVSQTALPTGGIAAQLSVRTNYLSPSLLDFIAQSVAGKVVYTTIQYATFTATAQPLSLLKISNTRIQEVDLPPTDSRKTDTVQVGVTFMQAPVETGKPTYPTGNPTGPALHYNSFHLQFDSLDATSAIAINGMAVRLPDVLKGLNLPQLVLTYSVSPTSPSSQAFAKGLQTWFSSQTTRNGTLTFFATDFTTRLLIVHYRGLRVLSINNAGTSAPTATFVMSGISIQSAGTP
jgi:hypothetical protein